jgi:4-amino-4-deoxy-L-arabinose transferase-like glycosyltransferase
VNARVAVSLVAAGGFVIRFLRLGAIENDHYVYLARAHQMLHGDWPVRDFVDPGFPLAYLLSFLAAAVAGPTLLTEAVLSVALFAVALAITYALTRRAAGSSAVAVVTIAVLLLFPPRLYNSSKMLVPIVAIAIGWAYCDRPTRLGGIALGLWTGIAFLFRHDYGVFAGTVTLAMLLVQHWGDRRLLPWRVLTCFVAAAVVVVPWLVYVQVEQGLPEYVASAVRFSVAERDRTVSQWPPVYYLMTAVPASALLVGFRGTRHVSRAQATFAALLVLLSDLVLLRDAPGSRLPDVYGITAVAAAILIGAAQLPRRRPSARWATAAIATAIAVVLAAVWLLPGRAAARFDGPLTRWTRVSARLRHASPEIMPDPARAPLVAYITRCTRPDDRVIVGGFGPELPVLAQRPFAAGLPDWIRGYYEDPADVARARSRFARERVSAAVMLDGGNAFSASWPALAADLRARGLKPYAMQLPGERVELWLQPSSRTDRGTGLPCAAAE